MTKLEDILNDWAKDYPHCIVNKSFRPKCSCHENMFFNATITCHCPQYNNSRRGVEITILEDRLEINEFNKGPQYRHLFPADPTFFKQLEALLPKVCVMKE